MSPFIERILEKNPNPVFEVKAHYEVRMNGTKVSSMYHLGSSISQSDTGKTWTFPRALYDPCYCPNEADKLRAKFTEYHFRCLQWRQQQNKKGKHGLAKEDRVPSRLRLSINRDLSS